ncbi:MAG: carboxylesterase family protein [Lachnospiraceae bacterium]|nr:carboxylesterase family protein [Lachnospiraceae bacterium]
MEYDPALIARTKNGNFVGKRNEKGTIVFRGIPYAKFAGRWKPVKPPDSMDGIIEAYENGPACPQISYRNWYASADKVKKDEENCFTLCVASSSLNGKKPVFVFIHGGANITGGYFDPRYDLQHFVDRNPDIVFVVFNYRLGPLGTLYLGEVTDDPDYQLAGNLTLLDQLAAFRWVKENISAFGGDPNNVTIGGRSSGSASVTLHLTIKESWPYWNRVFAQSGTTFNSRPLTISESGEATRRFMGYRGCRTVEQMLELTPDMLLSKFSLETNITFTADGLTLPIDLNAAICDGADELVSGKDILISCANGDMDALTMDVNSIAITRDNAEFSITRMLSSMTERELPYYINAFLSRCNSNIAAMKFLRQFTKNNAHTLIEMYLNKYPEENPFFVISDCQNDFCMENPLLLECDGMSRQNRVYHYIWTWAPEAIAPLRGYHGIDAPFMLNTQAEDELIADYFGTPEASHMFDIAQTMMSNFIRRGSPDTPNLKAIAYNADTRPVMIIDYDPHCELDPRKIDRELLYELFQRCESEEKEGKEDEYTI